MVAHPRTATQTAGEVGMAVTSDAMITMTGLLLVAGEEGTELEADSQAATGSR